MYVTRLLFRSFYLHSQIVLALASVPLCGRKTLEPYIRTYLKQASIFKKRCFFHFLWAVSDKHSTLYMTNDEFNRSWMVKSCIYCKLPSFEEVLSIISNFDGKKRFLKKKMHQWIWAFCSIDLCGGNLYFIRGMNMQFSSLTKRIHFFTF